MKAIIDRDEFNRLISATKKCTAKAGSARPMFCYIRLDFNKNDMSVTASALDGYKMAIETAKAGAVDEDFTAYILPTIPKCPKYRQVEVEKIGKKVFVSYGEIIYGYVQSDDTPFDYEKTWNESTSGEPAFRIGFNRKNLAEMMSGAGNKDIVVLEFRNPLGPIVIKNNYGSKGLVLPVRLPDNFGGTE